MKHFILFTIAMLFACMQAFSQTYTYDNLYRLTKVVYGNGVTVEYGYDALGNRISKNVTGATGTTFTISVVVTPEGSGSVTGVGNYSSGATVELNAIPNAGYKFKKWSDGVTDNPRAITVTQNITYTAQFEEDTSIPSIVGDIVVDGKVNQQDLNALVQAYVSNTNVTTVTDIDNDGALTMADITQLIKIINDNKIPFNANGHEFVDLGLPSGTLWATCNVGATSPEEAGDHFAWGEIETKGNYDWETYMWCDGTTPSATNRSLTKYCDRGGHGTLDGKITLELEDDAAHVTWGGDWHIPTREEYQELMDNCTFEWIETENNVEGYKIIGSNGNSIFLPTAGRISGTSHSSNIFTYWTSSLYMREDPRNNVATSATIIAYDTDTTAKLTNSARYRGFAVRPVLSSYTPQVHKVTGAPPSYLDYELVDLGLPSGALFATYNLGASSPEDYGCYYSWGEIIGSCDGKNNYNNTTYTADVTDYTEVGVNLKPADDAASMNWGGYWRMPKSSDIKELIDNKYTTCEWTTLNGINGYRITSIVKGFEDNSIFLPASGIYRQDKIKYSGEELYYLTSTLYSSPESSYNVGILYGDSTSINYFGNMRYYGFSIRPVVSFDDIVK